MLDPWLVCPLPPRCLANVSSTAPPVPSALLSIFSSLSSPFPPLQLHPIPSHAMSYGTIEGQGGPGPSSLRSSPRLRRPSGASLRASSAAGPILVPQSAPDQVTRLISEQYAYVPSSAALQETDLSVQPLGLDLPDEPPDAFRRQTLLSLDLLRGLLLVLLADENIQLFLRADRESDENWYSKQDKWTESPLYALRLLAVSLKTALRQNVS